MLGLKVALQLLSDVGAKQPELARQPSYQGPNLFEHAKTQIRTSLVDLDAIEGEARKLVAGSVRDVAPYAALIGRWGKAMQRISAVIEVPAEGAEHGREKVPVLTQKIVPGQWVLSALAMMFPVVAQAGGSGEFLAHMEARIRPPNVESYAKALETAGVPRESADREDLGRRSKGDWLGAIDRLWSEVFFRGAMPFSVPGHSLSMKAMRLGGQKRFMVGDPKGGPFEEKTPDAMAAYLSSSEIELPFDPFA